MAVRVRPLNEREAELRSEIVVRVSGNQIYIRDPAGGASTGAAGEPLDSADSGARSFTFDRCYWSVDNANGNRCCTQQDVFADVGALVLDNSLQGFNASVFAYGQTGSGKTFAMMGTPKDPGIIPLACTELFRRIDVARSLDAGYSSSVEVSYLEIYNEIVRDLLNPANSAAASKGGLKVREHASFGVYVQGLSRLVANSYEEVDKLLTLGGRERTVAATKMNAASSRSHAVLTLYLTQSSKEEGVNDPVRRMSKINMVDLAGSEHQADTGATGARMKEACSINKSLSALSNVISALASQSRHVPYRDSVLTRLLQESLGGNAKSVMLAAVSPAAVNFAQSLSTLRYANRAKSIVNKPVVNEGGDGAIIKSLKEEIERLKRLLSAGSAADVQELQDQLVAQSELIDSLRLSQDERRAKTAVILEQREQSLRDQGITLKDIGAALGRVRTPYLINLNPDPSLSETMIYYIREGATTVGFGSAENRPDIVLNGLRIADEHCTFDNMNSNVVVTPTEEGPTYVNGSLIRIPTRLTHGDRIVFGKSFVFRFADPVAAETAPPQEFGWEDAVREMSTVLGLKLGNKDSEAMNEALIRASFLADEANDMARSLGKRAVFAVDIEPQADGPPRVAIRSTSLLTGNSTVVPIAEFEDRVQLMYEVLVTNETGNSVSGLRAGEDPFYDPPPDELIGEGVLDLSPLARLAGVDKTIALSPDGELEVSIHAIDAKTFAFVEPVSDIRALYGTSVTFVLSIPAARNLPVGKCCGTFVQYNFPMDEDVEVTERVLADTRHPEFNYRDRFVLRIDDDFVASVKGVSLAFRVYGRAPLLPPDTTSASNAEMAARLDYLNTENQELLRLNETFIRQLEAMRRQVELSGAAARDREAKWERVIDENERYAARVARLEHLLAQADAAGRLGAAGAPRSPALLPPLPGVETGPTDEFVSISDDDASAPLAPPAPVPAPARSPPAAAPAPAAPVVSPAAPAPDQARPPKAQPAAAARRSKVCRLA